MTESSAQPLIGVLALQGAFEEHQACLEAVGCRTKQVRTASELDDCDGMVLPGGESTAMGLIGNQHVTPDGKNVWQGLQDYIKTKQKPVWGTCAGMILLAEQCVGASAVIENGQSLIGGVDMFVCRNYFGSQVSSFEMATPPPPPSLSSAAESSTSLAPYPGVFIRAPAILSAGPDVTVLGKVVATPCRQAAVVLKELERKLAAGENVVQLEVMDAEPASSTGSTTPTPNIVGDSTETSTTSTNSNTIRLPGAADGSNAREVISAVRKGNVLCTAFHPELTHDRRWHAYFRSMVQENTSRLE